MAVPVLMALVFAKAGTDMAAGGTAARATATRLGIALPRFRLVGLLQLAGAAGLAAGLAWTPLGIAAATGLVLLMLGALATHARIHDPVAAAAPALVCLAGAAGSLALFLA